MNKTFARTLFILIVTLCCTTACIRDKFKYYGYEDELEGYAPVDYVDPSQTWILTKECSNGVGGIPNNAERVVLLSGNPFTDDGVEILAEVYTSVLAGQYANLSFVAPPTINKVYAAALGENGEYLAFAESALNATIKFDGTVPTGNPKAITPQEIKYCFEAEYPKPGDWDYNDVVMTISKEIVRDLPNVVALNVSLDAVGYLEQIAAAIRLVGYPNNKVTITQNESSTFVREPARERKILTQKELQFASLNGDAVINLFDDAHLAMYHSDKDGNVYRRYFNTIENPTSDNKGAVQPAVKVTFYLDFDDENMARNFQLTELDPFILVQYGTSGSNFWEIHTYPYKLHEVVYHYYNGAAQSYDNLYTWAIPIPDGDFRYPLEGEPMGMLKNSIVSGSYQTIGHSFGEWVMDATSARDWYEYPADGAVY